MSELNKWELAEAVELCRQIESICPDYGAHVALTGGVLYKDNPRKDLDLVFYQIRQVEKIDRNGLNLALYDIGLTEMKKFGWGVKCIYGKEGKSVDIFFPDQPIENDNLYNEAANE